MTQPPAPEPLSPDQRYHFWIRRLHSLAGVIPLGVFLTLHLLTNASILGGEQTFDRNVARIHALGGLLYPVEIFGILLPLAFHAILGIKIATTMKRNDRVYHYTANWRYVWQRISGVIAALFILYHLYHMHWLGKPLAFMGGAQFDPIHPTVTAAAAIQSNVLIPIVYAIGVLAIVYHFANGMWTFLITWGVTVGQRAQRVSGRICAVLGVALAAVGLSAVVGFTTFRDNGAADPGGAPPHQARSEPGGIVEQG